jgi:hypothetical protein
MSLESTVDPEIAEKFHFTQVMLEGSIFRKYEKAMRGVWNALTSTLSRTRAKQRRQRASTSSRWARAQRRGRPRRSRPSDLEEVRKSRTASKRRHRCAERSHTTS